MMASGRFAEKARKQRLTPQYKEWRSAYEKTDKYKKRVLEYSRRRRRDPKVAEMLRQNARDYRERHRIRWLAMVATKRARRNGLPCDVEFMRSLQSLRPNECPCCGVKLNYTSSTRVHHPLYDGPSLDRVDTTKGYVRGNVDIICWRCNAIKRDATLSELEKIVAYMWGRL